MPEIEGFLVLSDPGIHRWIWYIQPVTEFDRYTGVKTNVIELLLKAVETCDL